MRRFLPGAVVFEANDPKRLYLVTATSDWGFEVKGTHWVDWDKAGGWERCIQPMSDLMGNVVTDHHGWIRP